MTDRPVIFVTAPFRGEGLAAARSVADVVHDPWIVGTADAHLRRRRAGRADRRERRHPSSSARPTSCTGEVLDRPLRVIGSTRGDPTNVDVAGATGEGHPGAARARPQRRRRRRDDRRAAVRGHPARPPRRPRRARAARCSATARIPYQRYRAWQLAGRTAGLVGLGAVGRATALAARGPRHARHLASTRTPRGHPRLARRAARPRPTSCRCTRAPTPDTLGHDGRRRSSPPCTTARSTSTRPAPALHDIDALVEALRSRATSAAPASTTSRASSCPTTTRCSRMDKVVLTPHIGGATYDTEVNHSR